MLIALVVGTSPADECKLSTSIFKKLLVPFRRRLLAAVYIIVLKEQMLRYSNNKEM